MREVIEISDSEDERPSAPLPQAVIELSDSEDERPSAPPQRSIIELSDSEDERAQATRPPVAQVQAAAAPKNVATSKPSEGFSGRLNNLAKVECSWQAFNYTVAAKPPEPLKNKLEDMVVDGLPVQWTFAELRARVHAADDA